MVKQSWPLETLEKLEDYDISSKFYGGAKKCGRRICRYIIITFQFSDEFEMS